MLQGEWATSISPDEEAEQGRKEGTSWVCQVHGECQMGEEGKLQLCAGTQNQSIQEEAPQPLCICVRQNAWLRSIQDLWEEQQLRSLVWEEELAEIESPQQLPWWQEADRHDLLHKTAWWQVQECSEKAACQEATSPIDSGSADIHFCGAPDCILGGVSTKALTLEA